MMILQKQRPHFIVDGSVTERMVSHYTTTTDSLKFVITRHGETKFQPMGRSIYVRSGVIWMADEGLGLW